MKTYPFAVLLVSLNSMCMDYRNSYEKQKKDKNMSPALYGLKYGFSALLEREGIDPNKSLITTISMVKNENPIELSTDNFTLYKDIHKKIISVHFKKSYAYTHKKHHLVFSEDHPQYKDLLEKVNIVIVRADEQKDINKVFNNKLKYFTISSSLIEDIQKLLNK